jgi:predicted SAM-dependent methyltransferase
VEDEYQLVQQRKRERLFGKVPLRGQGLEIGPLSRPLVMKSLHSVKYVDHCSTEKLIEKYPTTDEHISGIYDVDLIWNEKTILEINSDAKVDFIVASHVIEHVPNPVGWLAEVHEALNENGFLYLVIPDKRFTFDAFRSVTSIQEIREAAQDSRRKPGWRTIIDHFINVRKIDTWQAWDNYESINEAEPHHNLADLKHALDQFEKGEYVDIHTTVFTPWSFFEFMKTVQDEFQINFKLVDFLTTQDHDLEFYVVLQKSESKKQSWRNIAEEAFNNSLWPENAFHYRYTSQ